MGWFLTRTRLISMNHKEASAAPQEATVVKSSSAMKHKEARAAPQVATGMKSFSAMKQPPIKANNNTNTQGDLMKNLRNC